MFKKYILILLLFPLALFSQTKAEKKEMKKKQEILFSVKPVQKKFTETIAFTDEMDQILVPVVINGKTYNFLFDTGAITVIPPALVKELNLKPAFGANLVDGSGNIGQEELYTLPSLQIGNITFNNITTAVIDMSKFNTTFCTKIDGIFGTNIMRTCRWKVDYNNKQITFSDREIKPSGKVKEIAFEESFSGCPMLLQVMGEYNFKSTMDTGYNGVFSVPDSLYFKSRKSGQLKAYKMLGKAAFTLYKGKPTNEHVVLLDSMYVGNHLFKNVKTSIDGTMLLTGNKFFKRFGEMILDWNKQKLYLADVPVTEDTELMTFGFTPVRTDDNKVFVKTLFDESVAQRQGMENGDEIVRIDNTDISGSPDNTWCEIVKKFRDDSPDMNVTIRKEDGTEKSMHLKKYNLFSN